MSAVPQYAHIWAAASLTLPPGREGRQEPDPQTEVCAEPAEIKQPVRSLAFYRKHTESLLRRYLYSSMLVGRAPSILDHPVARGWATSRPVRTFEDAMNFVLDVERCLKRLSSLDRFLLNRIVVQEYTILEASAMLRITTNTVMTRLGIATDRLTKILLKEDLLNIPK